ncbi:ComF family protein [Cupriavidus gilardii J11]|uniref:ComF family protein n=1 Tax=Cupriavidus gilardii J11 TaxID=936133 RepID=A0A562BF68_9BURK|nr:ComF family protein [Cupriavidus gilardii]TWG83814.1 ComF family protein [Cupriavidus gilardii J11]
MPCAICQLLPPPYDAAVTLADYRPPRDALVLALKFRGTLALASWLGRQLADAVGAHWRVQGLACAQPLPLIAPIPLGPRRLAQRGFNQSWEIARAMAARLAWSADPTLLARRHDTSAQSGLPLVDRHANIAGAFVVPRADRVARRHIVLVDDVMTTGATLAEASATLKRHGAARVTVAVVLRTPAPGE